MDTFLVRPASPFIQMLGQVMHFQAILSMAVYVGDPCLVYPGNRTFYRRAGNHIADRIYHLRYDDQFGNLYDF